ncbi:hypothetical protein LINPERHAP1_LOCUS24085 [Linum perenne]
MEFPIFLSPNSTSDQPFQNTKQTLMAFPQSPPIFHPSYEIVDLKSCALVIPWVGNYPYGITIGKTTGRTSEGLLIVDHIDHRLKMESSLFMLGGGSADYVACTGPPINQKRLILPYTIGSLKQAVKSIAIRIYKSGTTCTTKPSRQPFCNGPRSSLIFSLFTEISGMLINGYMTIPSPMG